MKKIHFFSLLILLNSIACHSQDKTSIKVEVKNDISNNISNQLATIKISDLSQLNVKKIAAFDGGVEIPSQLVDVNADGKMDYFTFLVDLDASQIKNIVISETENKKVFSQRAHAEISEKSDFKLVDGVYTEGKFVSVKRTKIPEGHTDHNLYYRMEGPSWESDKVAYRFYIDQRNATDIYGKKVSDMVLPTVGHTYDESGNEMYHTMQDWGMDIFKVGNSLGMGSFAALVDGKVEMLAKRDSVVCTIENDGPIFASVNTKYYGWEFDNQKIDVDATHSIVAGSRLTKNDISVSGNYASYCSGFAKHDGTEFIKSNHKNGWNYISLWGNQTMIKDNVGLVLFYNKDYNETVVTEDELSYIVNFTPKDGNIQYYYAACWEQELNGIKTKDEFIKYIDKELEKLNNPVELIVVK